MESYRSHEDYILPNYFNFPLPFLFLVQIPFTILQIPIGSEDPTIEVVV